MTSLIRGSINSVFIVFITLIVLPVESFANIPKQSIEHLIKETSRLKETNADSALYYGNKALELAQKENLPKLQIKAINVLSDIYYFVNQRENAFELLTEALEISKKYQLDEDRIEILYNLGLHYSRSGRKGSEVIDEEKIYQGLDYYEEAIELAKTLELPKLISKGYNLSAVNYQRLENFQKSLEFYRLSESYSRAANDSIGLGYTLDYSATLLTSMGEFNKAEEMLREALAIRKALGDPFPFAINLNNIGEFYYSQEKFNSAVPYLEQSFEISESKDYKDLGLHTAGILSSIYNRFNDYEKAYILKVKEQKMKDSLFNEQRMKTLENLEKKYESEIKEKELLKTKKIVAENELKAVKRLSYIYYLSGGSLLLILIGVVIVQKVRRKENEKRVQLELKSKAEATKAIINAQEEEQRRIARDLHDGIGQQLGGLKLMSHQLKNQTQDQEIEKFTKIIDQAAEEVRSISHQMMPKSLMNLGLSQAAEDVLQSHFNLHSITYSFDVIGKVRRLENYIEITLFRILQELSQNVIKHAKATEVYVQLIFREDEVILRYEDNGVGFNLKENSGIGLMNIKTRLEMIKGKLNIETEKEKGSTFIIKIDLKPALFMGHLFQSQIAR